MTLLKFSPRIIYYYNYLCSLVLSRTMAFHQLNTLKKRKLPIHKTPAKLEPQHQIVWCHKLGHSLVGGLVPLQRSSQCILQPQPSGQIKAFRVITGHSLSLTLLLRCSRCILPSQSIVCVCI